MITGNKFSLIGILAITVLLTLGCTQPETDTGGGTVPTPGSDNTGPVGSNPLLEFANSLGAQTPDAFSISYQLTTTVGQSTQAIHVSQNKFRSDSIVNGVETRIVITDEVSALCTTQSGDWDCLDAPISDAEKQQVYNSTKLNDVQIEQLSQLKVTDAASQTFLGIPAKCFSMQLPNPDPAGEALAGVTCYHPNSFITLFSEVGVEGTQNFVRQEVSGFSLAPPSDTAFDLPATLQIQVTATPDPVPEEAAPVEPVDTEEQ
jgi:hypothetical protein